MKMRLALIATALLCGCGHGSTERPTLGDFGRGAVSLAAAPRVGPPANWRALCRQVRPLAVPPAGGDTNGWREAESAGDYRYTRSGQLLTDASGRLVEKRLTWLEADYVGPVRGAIGGPWRCGG